MIKIYKTLGLLLVMSILFGCSNTLVSQHNKLPEVYVDINETHRMKRDITIAVFALNNYTDTPLAGMRATNLLQGVLMTKGYNVVSEMQTSYNDFETALQIAKQDKADYFIHGGVSEWRYRTGIDGEPAISMQCNLVETNSSKTIWSATASDSDWGNASIGVTAQELILNMLSATE